MKQILITGISGGIGRKVAEELLKDGNKIIGADLFLSEEVKAFREKYAENAALYEVNLMEAEKLSGFVRNVVSEHGMLGGFVHCAGFDKMAPLHLQKIEDIENLWRLHALAPMVIIGEMSKRKNHSGNCSIVLITSQSAHEGAMGHSSYAAAKGAIEGFLAPAAAELMEKGIRINEVCFAPVRTKMSSEWMERLSEADFQRLCASYPLGLGEVEDASNLICFLLSEKAKWINGQIITADGGHSVRKV